MYRSVVRHYVIYRNVCRNVTYSHHDTASLDIKVDVYIYILLCIIYFIITI